MSSLPLPFAEIAAFAGTPDEVREDLDGISATRVVALTLGHGSAAEAEALAETVSRLAPIVGTVVALRQDEALRAIVEGLVPNVPPPPHRLIEARMTAEARRAVLASGDWMTAAEIAAVAGFSPGNPSAQPNRWKRDGRIFALRHNGVDYFPAYGLDPATGHRPVPALARVIEILRAVRDDWGLAYWFASVNGFLGGRRPQDLLIDAPERVIAAAEDEAAGVAHG
ncbi:hypothetical protein [Oharaeibacter diazotrophicus]|uniref:Uncharacterized protein n=1 Tax=Oharaeibacter diazotrophicus TaxID=1920512 RepID=A0A4R6RBC0_9HYPH|nr:hypothetical protein [Oharaeibacter diazotrophicus]TDP83324.1 hypothetical protein EDD54_3286 [Oharaeibacter diazotrophicus]BBE72157.1 hypothetical protein OHA_1_01746 [Pleomorphomonas sp. SM30]GLS78923.1 hypothetical protein GCM10007904_42600 [Oharaeibacter diazotrophicus]